MCFPLQWEKLSSCELVVKRLVSSSVVSLSFLIDSFVVLKEGSGHGGLHQDSSSGLGISV